jgi:hypothetical protein
VSEISALFEGKLKTPGRQDRTVALPIDTGSTVTSTLQELAMKRIHYVVGGLAARVFVVVVPATGVYCPATIGNSGGDN